MRSFWEKTKETLKQKASTLGVKVGEYSKYSKLALKKYNLTKQVEKLATELGGRVYTLFSDKMIEKVKSDEEILNYLLKIRGLENEIEEAEEKMKNMKKEEKTETKPR